MEIAKVADFGLSKLMHGEDVTHVDTQVKGTIGYLDPEYFSTGQLSTKSDVFSFGVVLLEMITGRMPTDPTIQQCNHSNTSKWVEANIREGNINEILDPIIKASNPNLETIWKVLELAMQCIQHESSQRPAMNEVVQELRIVIDMENNVQLHKHDEFNDMKVKTTMHLSHASNIESQVHLVDYKLSSGTSDLYPV
jgi:serine/threonine protein kinase